MKYINAEKLKRFVEELKERAKRNRYDSWGIVPDALEEVEGFITSLQQEQPEVDLEKEIAKENEKWTCYEEIGFGALYDARPFDGRDIDRIARHFYKLGLNAIKDR